MLSLLTTPIRISKVAHRDERWSLHSILVKEKQEHTVIGVVVSPIRVLEHIARRPAHRRRDRARCTQMKRSFCEWLNGYSDEQQSQSHYRKRALTCTYHR